MSVSIFIIFKRDNEFFHESAKDAPVQRVPLKHRDYEVDLSSRLGKTQVSGSIL